MRTIRLKRRDTFLVCGKCLKRHPDGKAIRRALKHGSKEADAKVVRTSCLGVCPKRAVLVASRASLAEARVMLVAGVDDATAVFNAEDGPRLRRDAPVI